MNRQRLLLITLLLLAILGFYVSGAHTFFTLETLQAYRSQFQAAFQQSPWQVAGLFFAVYVVMTALSLPGAALLTLLGGALFGLGWGLLIISFASTLGATLAFLLSRFLFRGPIEKRFPRQFETVNRGVEKDGAFYLFTLRLVPIFPFFMINLVMGLTRIKLTTFYWVSQLGMLPGTAVYVNAGGQLGELESLGGIVSPGLLASFALLAVFPWLARRIAAAVQTRKVYQDFTRPARFDYDIVVIGGGSAGLVTSYIASAVNAKVALVEKHKMGGDCLNTGCVPSKALIRAARAAHEIRTAHRFGVSASAPEVDFAKVMGHVHQAIADIEPHDSVERYTGLGGHGVSGPRPARHALASSRGEYHAHRAPYRAGHGGSPTGAAAARHRARATAHLGKPVVAHRAAQAPGGAGRRRHWLRTQPKLCSAGQSGHPG